MDNVFFVISKLAWGILSPGNLLIWGSVLVTFLIIAKRFRSATRLSVIITVAGGAVMAYPIGDMIMYPLEQQFDKPKIMPSDIDGIIVLGGGIDLKRSVDWGQTETGHGADRYISAVILAKQYPSVPIIFSGGSGLLRFQNTGSEGLFARKLLIQLGVEPSRLIIESQARNTFENMLYIRSLLPVKEGRYLLITSAYHMPRSVGVARKMAIDVIPYPVDYRSNRPLYRQWDFNFYEHLQVLEPAWHEWIGLTVYYWTGKTTAWFPAQKTAIR